MLKSLVRVAFFLLAILAVDAIASDGKLVDDVKESLARSSKVVLIFTDVVDQNRSWKRKDYLESATAKLEIYCRSDCVGMMKVVLDQLSEAKRIPGCPRGNKFLIINFSAEIHDLKYYYYEQGRIVEYDGSCYRTEGSIRDIIHIFDLF